MENNNIYLPATYYIPPPPPQEYHQHVPHHAYQAGAPTWQPLNYQPLPQFQQHPPANPNPWRKGEYNRQNHKTNIDIYALVDSWRSYKDDASNLQTATSTSGALNAHAAPFQPNYSTAGPTNPKFKPYEPLSYRVDKAYRVSNGIAERKMVQDAAPAPAPALSKKQKKKKKLVESAVQPTTEFSNRYPVRSTRGTQPDQPVPSIEAIDDPYLAHIRQSLDSFENRRHASPRKSRTKSPEPPTTDPAYIAKASKEPILVDEPRKLLVVLDLNGTLLYRNRRAVGQKCYMRPGVAPFIDYLFDNHVVMIYTSAKPDSAASMVSQFLHPTYRNKLAALWARDKLDLTTSQYNNKVQVYKKLGKVWNDISIQTTAGPGHRWDQSNTVLIDDSKLKALAQPHNLLQVPEYDATLNPEKGTTKEEQQHMFKSQQDLVQQLQSKLEVLKYQADVSRLIRRWQDGTIAVPSVPGQEVSVEETVDQKDVQEKRADNQHYVKDVQAHLPTPDSLEDQDDSGVGLESNQDTGDQIRSESPIDESVFRELLEGSGKA
ncbi:hypothetical protein LTS08_006111 [Lithohypha guttulata]|nr:hypothetical protein LTS08_006111 [Lithohypha guttulata]